jgi:hypothetical protein
MLGMNNVESDRAPPQSASRSSDRCVSHYRIARKLCRNVMIALPSSYDSPLRNLSVLDAG